MDIRELTEADYEQALELYQALDELHAQARPDCFIHREKDQVYPKLAFVQHVASEGALELGAFEEGRMVGVAGATLLDRSGMVKDAGVVCLDNLYVAPDCRRRGIATGLFAAVEAWAQEKGAVRLELHTWDFNKRAIALYQAMGMTPQRHVFEKKLSPGEAPRREP